MYNSNVGNGSHSRDCCGDMFKPMLDPSRKAIEMKTGIYYVFYAHCIVTVIKMCLWGFGNGFQDVICCLILYCGVARFDYCQMICYIIFVCQILIQFFVGMAFYF